MPAQAGIQSLALDPAFEKYLMVMSNFMVPEARGSFCERGGRFGAHSSNESMAPVFYKKLAFVTFFNAGVRAIDVRKRCARPG